MLQEKLTENEVFVVEFVKFVFCDSKLTLVWSLEKVLWWFHFKNSFSSSLASSCNQKSNRLDAFSNFFTLCCGLAKVWISSTIKSLNCGIPLLVNWLKQGGWNCYKSTSSIHHRRVSALLAYWLHPIERTFTRKRPGFDVGENVWIVSERSQTIFTSNNLGVIDSTKDSKHAVFCETQRESGFTDLLLFHQRPDQMLVWSICAHLGR